jgi:hypothetical protein
MMRLYMIPLHLVLRAPNTFLLSPAHGPLTSQAI